MTRTALSEKIPPIDRMTPAQLESALFAMGCFKGLEARLGITRGVWRTSVGLMSSEMFGEKIGWRPQEIGRAHV